jgi:hypothetical protein
MQSGVEDTALSDEDLQSVIVLYLVHYGYISTAVEITKEWKKVSLNISGGTQRRLIWDGIINGSTDDVIIFIKIHFKVINVSIIAILNKLESF